MTAQFAGGNGRGEITAVTNANALNGQLSNIYAGGKGRGDILSGVNDYALSGTMPNIFSGGNGRGEVITMLNANELNGGTAPMYGGGNGRGETSSVINTNDLNGFVSTIFGGGNGRGENVADTNSMQLNGIAFNIYGGGDGRGETILGVNALQLDGLSENTMFLGGDGRGESSQQFSNAALPITLLSFSAAQSNKHILVKWQTSSEINSDFFIVEKSVDGSNWQSIGKIAAAGQSSVPLLYQLTDDHPVEGTNYYRLKQTDRDGKYVYSPVASVHYRIGNASAIVIFPNPVKYQFTIALQGLQADAKLHVSLINAHGQTVFEKGNLSGNTHTFNISSLAGGTYFLLINNNGQITSSKIVKE